MTSEEALQKQKQIEAAKKKKEIEKEQKKIREQKRAEREKQQDLKKKTKETKRKTAVRKSTREKKMKVEKTCGICGQEWEDITEEEELWLDCGMFGGWFHAKCIGYNDREDLDDINYVCDICT